MRTSLVKVSAIAALLAASATLPAQAAIVFSDTFNYGSTSQLNWTPPSGSGWSITGGTVDYIVAPNSWNLTCATSSDGCIDLDGSTGNAGLMSNSTYVLQAGTTYTLSALVSGNQRGGAADSLLFGFRDANGVIVDPDPLRLTTQLISGIAANAGYTLYSLVFVPTATITGVSIFFEAGGGDNVGPMLDNVTLTTVPLPAAAWLLLSGLVGFAALGRRRTMAA